MRILHISDIHCSYMNLEKVLNVIDELGVDVIVVSGDLECDHEIVGKLVSIDKPVVAVPGNMDDHYIARLLREHEIGVDAQCREVNGYYFTGVSGLEVYTSLIKAKECLKNHGRKTILVSHHPPRASKIDVTWGDTHAGLADLRQLILEYKPVACLCGHIHEGRGYEYIGETLCVNPGPLAMGYYAIVGLDKGEVELREIEIK